MKAGTTLKQLNRYLEDHGLAMKNLGSISDQSVAGAVSTGMYVYSFTPFMSVSNV